jgi:hypothetical protein
LQAFLASCQLSFLHPVPAHQLSKRIPYFR